MKKARKSCKLCAECCRHVALEIDVPRSKKDFRMIIWYVLHRGVKVFIDEKNDWYIEFKAECGALTSRGRCGVYSRRPDICSEYDPDNCVRHGEGEHYEVLLESREDVERYVERRTNIKDLYS